MGRSRRGTRPSSGYRFLLGAILCTVLFVVLLNVFVMEGVETLPRAEAAASQGQLTESKEKIAMVKVDVSDIYDTVQLRVVDKNHRLDDDRFETVTAYKKVPVSTDSIRLNSEALTHLQALLQGAGESGVKGLVVTSGYRTAQRQQELYSAEPDSGLVAEPLASEHNTGLAVDFATTTKSRAEFSATDQGAWVKKNASRYGFVQSYPEGSETITGIKSEPWHYRYVGTPHAEIITQKGWTLNEYIEALKPGVLYTCSGPSGTWAVCRVMPQKGKIQIPKDHTSISSDGAGGYVVTIKQS